MKSRRGPSLKRKVRFTGYASESQWVNEFKSLQEDMQKNGDGESAGKGLIYFSGYNSPMEIFNRRNEIWISMTKAANAI
ncbi:unnamed protein product [Cyprideis torosa]|uniref:Uncharacterized protein n=1 Tax=Cyprideis torosa TaxID=163714 RepID=A0A7R8WGR7_9CRUS|nr:unnamed protein product [Cyprideis torosa]CAG0898447.1 unnamed protein product [Cyprideis torosa]